MGKAASKEKVVIAQNANGTASATTLQYHQEKLEIIETLITVAVVILVAGSVPSASSKKRANQFFTINTTPNSTYVQEMQWLFIHFKFPKTQILFVNIIT